ncbi:uncharacterized protein LOC143888633 [Tasmannia lanceolata]|uniref:uncharacterized protein LOC143888633 n=1 Tax=Tasmannia lanceolata TaxID=3420 RepID=UPI0040637CCC
MATSSRNVEGQSLTRPSYFNGTNYSSWKTRMTFFLQSHDYDMWELVEDGYIPPSTQRSEWTDAQKKRAALNSKGVNTLFCALSPEEFNRVSTCKTARDIWTTLETTHEGTTQVKKTKINLIVSDFEAFKMKNDESIYEIYTRFTNIINELEGLGKTYTNEEIVNKLLRSLPASWDLKITAIEEAKNLDTILLEELVGSLITHEMKMKKRSDQQGHKDDPKKKGIAFKANADSESESEGEKFQNLRKGLALLTKKFRHCSRRKKGGFKKDKPSWREKDAKEDDPPRCYRCKKVRHIRPNCPFNKQEDNSRRKKKEKNKSFSATWDGLSCSAASESSEEEDANICFMALESHEEEVYVEPLNLESEFIDNENDIEKSFSYDELFDACEKFQEGFILEVSKTKNLKSSLEKITKEFETLTKERDLLVYENNSLNQRFDNLVLKTMN